MKLLILGGTLFLGRHLVGEASARGHEVTIFNRGRRNPELFPEVERLRGDRDGGLDALRGRSWDAVVDTSGYVPRVVRASAELLADAVGLYVFVSSVSAYADFSRPFDEDSPAATMPDETVEEVNGETYGPLKVLCERAAEAAMPGRVLVLRPGLIVGPHDPTVRFSYWTARVARGGEVLAPGDPARRIQFVDARDLAAWTLRMAEAGRPGLYNAAGPDYALTMGRFLEECRAASASDASFTWVGEQFLLERGVEPWSELPLWMPESSEKHRYFLRADIGRALAFGLTFRPLRETIRDTLAWQRETEGQPLPSKPGLPQPDVTLKPERERELLDEWHRRSRQ
ncbi:MAG TPA: SDR family oxidoreductase [Pyrinomonadaceae bacterium]|nr:SDR family oxidoreductase [Pyrinomonadaceae bacterium]